MPVDGFRVATIRKNIWGLAKKHAAKEGISVPELIAKAVQRYIDRKLETEEELRMLMEVYEEHKRKFSLLSSSQHTH